MGQVQKLAFNKNLQFLSNYTFSLYGFDLSTTQSAWKTDFHPTTIGGMYKVWVKKLRHVQKNAKSCCVYGGKLLLLCCIAVLWRHRCCLVIKVYIDGSSGIDVTALVVSDEE